MGSSLTAGRVIRENEEGAGLRTIMRIGRAGEQLVPYASVTTETYRHFGRLGLGAVFGSKKLKALVVSGKRIAAGGRPQAPTAQLYDEIHQTAVTSPVMKKYHDLGTAENVLPLNALGGLPTRNLQARRARGRRAHLRRALRRALPGPAPGLRPLPGGLHPHRRPARALSERALLLQDHA